MDAQKLSTTGKILMMVAGVLYALFWIVGLIIWGPPVSLDIILPIIVGIFFGVIFLIGLILFLIPKFKK